MPNNIWKIKDHWIFLECSDRVTALIRIITDDALHIPVNIATLQQFVNSLKTSHAGLNRQLIENKLHPVNSYNINHVRKKDNFFVHRPVVVIGMALIVGMTLATLLGVFLYPMLFVFIGKIAGYEKKRELAAQKSTG